MHNHIVATKNKHIPTTFVKLNKHRHKRNKWITQGVMRSIKYKEKLNRDLNALGTTHSITMNWRGNLASIANYLKQLYAWPKHNTLQINLKVIQVIYKKNVGEYRKYLTRNTVGETA